MYTGVITAIRDIQIYGEFKILKFTVDKYVDEFTSIQEIYELAPSLKDGDGWLRTNDSMFEEPEIKTLVNSHLHNWPDDLASEFERRQQLKFSAI